MIEPPTKKICMSALGVANAQELLGASDKSRLLPALYCLPLQRLGREFAELDADSV